ncbi:MAG TPA: crossover junction endodeoxyribonuclease RuvC [Pseudobdellovibrionaceae bacterium]|nr:crossover junction endodeoxyribonuclease RuvC [Pseudobdellovibrionaceae bacterium]
MKIIVGIDPGTYRTGFGVVQVDGEGRTHHLNHGVFELNTKSSFYERLAQLGASLEELFKKYQPDSVVVEKIFLGKNVDSIFKLGHARGVILYEAQKVRAEIFEYATRSVKKGVAGNGGAEKVEVQAALQFFLQIDKIKSMDASDALAMAVFHGIQMNHSQLLKRARFI